jgi:hypothetical protein
MSFTAPTVRKVTPDRMGCPGCIGTGERNGVGRQSLVVRIWKGMMEATA